MVIKLPCFDMVITLDDKPRITSNLHTQDDSERMKLAYDVLETMILSHASAGYDITQAGYIEGIEESVKRITWICSRPSERELP